MSSRPIPINHRPHYVIILNEGEKIASVWEKFKGYAQDNDIEKIDKHVIPNVVNEMVKEKYNRNCIMISLSGGLSTVLNMIQDLGQYGRNINGLFTINQGSITVIDILELAEGSETKVVNVKVTHIRPEYDNLKSWCSNPENIYIGRRGIVFVNTDDGGKERFPKKDSIFANPYKVGKKHTLDESLELYEKNLAERLDNEPDLVHELLLLQGKQLGCWCKPNKCHGDILLKLITKYT